MEEKRDSNGFLSLRKTKSQDSGAASRRRGSSVSSGSNWFKKLGHKITNLESEVAHPERRRGSSSSLFSGTSQESEHLDQSSGTATSSSGTTAASSPMQTSPQQVSRSQSIKDSFRRRAQSITGPGPQLSSSVDSVSSARIPGAPPGAQANRQADTGPRSSVSTEASTGPATLSDLKKRKISTRAVGFSLSTFKDNPPQRIPPVSPAEGNIQFTDNGDIIVHKRVRGYFGEHPSLSEKNHAELARLSQTKARQNAERLHTSITSHSLSSLFSSRPSLINNSNGQSAGDSALDDEEPTNKIIATHDVDGMEHVKLRHRGRRLSEGETDEEGWDHRDVSTGNDNPPPDQVYIRCCHLREIMPIRNILRQLQGQLSPIPRIRVANTKPTLVEIQAFSDFLTAVPVSSLVLDNHILTDEMLRLIFAGITRSRDIARITFVNTQIGPLGWQYMCSFLANCRKSLLALNLSCTDPTGIPSRVPAFNREDMDWRLLAQALAEMGTLEELDLGGTKIKIDDLKYLVKKGFKNGRVLGLANNNLGHDDVKFIADWAELPETQLMGINLSGNDLSKEEDWAIVQCFLTNPRIFQLSLRNSKLSHMHASHIVKAISPDQAKRSNLRQLDLSYNPELFPYIVSRLAAALPNFPYLSRLQLEHCNLTSETIVTICESLSHCHRLVYLSVAGNGPLTESAATALCVAVHLSRSICTVEADINESNVVLRQQLARYCIQNLEKNAGNVAAQLQPQTEEEDDNEDISSFHDDLRAAAKAIDSHRNKPMSAESKKAVVDNIEDLRNRIKLRMHSLLIKRKDGPLCVKDREATMRLFFYSTALDRLKRDATEGENVQEPANAEETVENVGEEDLRPSLNRKSSQASIASLKSMERAEGESHRAYSEELMDLDDDSILDAVGKLKVRDLEHIMS